MGALEHFLMTDLLKSMKSTDDGEITSRVSDWIDISSIDIDEALQ